jgi:hypothetical protein
MDCTSLINITIPNTVTNIGNYAFADCSGLTSFTIPNGLSSIGDGMFQFTGLTNVTIPGNVTSIGRAAFYYCYHLTSVTISNGVAAIGDQAFWECTSLTNITIPQSVTSIGFEVFDSCSSLTTITVDSLNSNYSSMDGILFDKSRSTLIECPPGKSGSYTIPNGVTRIADNAFEYCLGLTDVIVPNSVTDLGDFVFQQCHNLTRITILGSVASIGYEDFFACFNLTTVILPSTLTSIEPYAFDACSSLTTIVVPAGVTNIGDGAFYQTPTSLYFLGNAPSIGNLTFGLHGIVYYLPGTTGWAPTLGGLSTAPWVRPTPLILTTGSSFGVQSNAFGFIISWATNISVVVEASSSLDNPNWSSLQTNTLIGGWCYFSDSQWMNYPARYYRVRSP